MRIGMDPDEKALWKTATWDERDQAGRWAKAVIEARDTRMRSLIVGFAQRDLRSIKLIVPLAVLGCLGVLLLGGGWVIDVLVIGCLIAFLAAMPFYARRLKRAIAVNGSPPAGE